jgi:homocysteine S-methyltransferase
MFNNPIANHLTQESFVVIDGGLATELERYGCDINDTLWSAKVLLETPHIIRQVHLDYLNNGADCVTTASYQATIPGFVKRGLSVEKATELLWLSACLALEAREQFLAGQLSLGRLRPFIAASIGPYGAFKHDGSEYSGDYDLSEDELYDFHFQRIATMVDSGVDMLAFETMPCLLEAKVLLRILQQFPDMSAWFSFTAQDGTYNSHHERMVDCVKLLHSHPQVAAIGVNCVSPLIVPDLIANLHPISYKPIIVYPNSGECYQVDDNTWSGNSHCAEFGSQAALWYEAGAQILGGCCRTTPAHIQNIVDCLSPERQILAVGDIV